VEFDGSGLASGVYFYKIQVRGSDFTSLRDSRGEAGDFVQAKKMLVVK
jgi:hypothetical protein